MREVATHIHVHPDAIQFFHFVAGGKELERSHNMWGIVLEGFGNIEVCLHCYLAEWTH